MVGVNVYFYFKKKRYVYLEFEWYFILLVFFWVYFSLERLFCFFYAYYSFIVWKFFLLYILNL